MPPHVAPPTHAAPLDSMIVAYDRCLRASRDAADPGMVAYWLQCAAHYERLLGITHPQNATGNA